MGTQAVAEQITLEEPIRKAAHGSDAEDMLMLAEFVRGERLRGRRSTRKLPYLLKPFFSYLKREGLTVQSVGFRQAQGYQGFLSTLAEEDGELHYRARTVKDMISAVRRFYAFLKLSGRVARDPFAEVEGVRCSEELPRNLPEESVMDALLAELRSWGKRRFRRDRKTLYRLHVMAEFLWASGLRIDELARLRVEDVDTRTRLVHVHQGKGGKDRTAYLSQYAAEVLECYLSRMRPILCTPEASTLFGVKNGRALDRMLNSGLKREAAAFGLERFTAHAIRHTLGFHLLRRGCDLRYIQLILGHESLSATTLYTMVEKRDLRRQLDRFHPRGGAVSRS
jgi:site-specific recombinase XerD